MNNIDPTKFGFIKSENKIWFFTEDWFLPDINPEYDYYKSVSIHTPLHTTDSIVTKFTTIYVHWIRNVSVETYKADHSYNFFRVFYGLIESQEDLEFVLNKLKVLPQNQTNDKRDS